MSLVAPQNSPAPNFSQGCVPLAQIPWVDPSSPAAGEAAEPEVALINVLLGVFK